MIESVKGFQTNEGTKQYDYNALANKPTLITQDQVDATLKAAKEYTDAEIKKLDISGGNEDQVIDVNEYVELLPESNYSVSEEMGIVVIDRSLTFIAGKTYLVKWNGVDYVRVAYRYEEDNELIILGEDNDPFYVEYWGNNYTDIYVNDSPTNVTLAIYQKIAYATEEWVEEKLKEHSGGNEHFHVEITRNPDGSYTADKTRTEVFNAYKGGSIVYCSVPVATGTRVDIPLKSCVFGLMRFEGVYNEKTVTVQYVYDDSVNPVVDNVIKVEEVTLVTGNVVRTVNGIKPNVFGNVTINIPDSGESVDLTGYAKEQWVQQNYQSKGDYALKSELPNVPTKLSELTNDSGFITGYTETDPTVPAWAKSASKPSYSKSEVGLGNVDNVKQYSASNPPPYPVTSVNGKTGAVTITVPTVPTKVSAFENDKGYLTQHQDISGKLDASVLPTAINTALAQAKASGEFDGQPGEKGEKGEKGDKGDKGDKGEQGAEGKKPVKGVDYFTEADKAEIVPNFAFSINTIPAQEQPSVTVQGAYPNLTHVFNIPVGQETGDNSGANGILDEMIILTPGLHYGETLPEPGNKGRVFFLIPKE